MYNGMILFTGRIGACSFSLERSVCAPMESRRLLYPVAMVVGLFQGPTVQTRSSSYLVATRIAPVKHDFMYARMGTVFFHATGTSFILFGFL